MRELTNYWGLVFVLDQLSPMVLVYCVHRYYRIKEREKRKSAFFGPASEYVLSVEKIVHFVFLANYYEHCHVCLSWSVQAWGME